MAKHDLIIGEYERAGIPFGVDEKGYPKPDWAAHRKAVRVKQDASFEKGPWKPDVRRGTDPKFPWEAWAIHTDGGEEIFARYYEKDRAVTEARDVAFHLNETEPAEETP